MRECHNNYAHGPMKLVHKNITVHYRGMDLECEKLVYACSFCGFELHEKWMEEKLEEQLAKTYQKINPS